MEVLIWQYMRSVGLGGVWYSPDRRGLFIIYFRKAYVNRFQELVDEIKRNFDKDFCPEKVKSD
jgi:hypothetical protein